MKSFITTLIIAVTLITGSFLYTGHLRTESEKLLDITLTIKTSVLNENYARAKEELTNLTHKVSDFEDFFLTTGDHLEIDNIKINLAELKSFIYHRKKTDALSKIYVLEFLFRHLPESSRLCIGNIL